MAGCPSARWVGGLGALAVAMLGAGCSKEPASSSKEPAKEPASKPAASASAATSASAQAGPAACKVGQEKLWTRWVNRDAGLTFVPLDNGRLAFGVADGENPRVLVFSRLGVGTLVEVSVAKDDKLAKELPVTEGRRTVFRVSPALDASRQVTAHVDYRDEHPDGSRRVACVPAQTGQSRLVYDDQPLIKDGKLAGLAATVADAGTDTPEVVMEVQNCRTFVNPGGRTSWAAGARLRMEKLPNRSLKWSWQWFVDPGGELPFVVLKDVAFEGLPKEWPQYEPLGAQRLVDGSYLLTAREKDALWVWGLGSAHELRGEAKSYPGGVPTEPRFAQDGAEWWLLTSRQVDKTYQLGSAKLPGNAPPLPAEVPKLEPKGLGASLTEPGLVRIKDERWLAYQTGKHHDGELMVVNVDEKLQPKGAPFRVSAPDETVHAAYLTALEDGELLMVYIQNGAPGADLISKRLTCWAR